MVRLTTVDGPLPSRGSSSTTAASQKAAVTTTTATAAQKPTVTTSTATVSHKPTATAATATASQKPTVTTPTATGSPKATVTTPATTPSQKPTASAPTATTQNTSGHGSVDIANQLLVMAHGAPDMPYFEQLPTVQQQGWDTAAVGFNSTMVSGPMIPLNPTVGAAVGVAYSITNKLYPEQTGFSGADLYGGTATYVAAQEYQAQMKIDRTKRTMQAMAHEGQIQAESVQTVVQTGKMLDQTVSNGVRATLQAVESSVKNTGTLVINVVQATGRVLQSTGQAVRAQIASPASEGGGTGAKGAIGQMDSEAE